MKMRLFLALSLTSNLLKKIAFLESKLDNSFKINFPWIPLKKLHLTLIFLGNINFDDYLKINQIFQELPKFKSCHLKIEKIDYGPPNRKRMIWLYIKKNDQLENLKKIIEEKLDEKRIIYQREERNFLPHINLARLKKINNLPEIKQNLNWQVILNELSLYQSTLNPQGADYEKLLKLDLNYQP